MIHIGMIIIFVLVLILIVFVYKKEYFINTKLFDELQIYAINLERRPDKKKNIENELHKYNLNYIIYKAIDGRMLDVDNMIKNKQNIVTNRKLRNTEYGCYLSHVNIWKDFLKSNKKFCLVLEDDAVLCHDFIKKLYILLSDLNKKENENVDGVYMNENARCIKFFGDNCNNKKTVNTMNYINKSQYLGYGMYGYLLTKNGIIKILPYINPITKPIDVLLHDLNFENKITIHKTADPYIMVRNLSDSDTQKE
jgi:glycosyl transferase family 25